MKINKDNCDLLISGNKYEQIWVKISNYIIWESRDVRLLGIIIDSDSKFEKHLPEVCKEAKKNQYLARAIKIPYF